MRTDNPCDSPYILMNILVNSVHPLWILHRIQVAIFRNKRHTKMKEAQPQRFKNSSELIEGSLQIPNREHQVSNLDSYDTQIRCTEHLGAAGLRTQTSEMSIRI